MRRLLLIFCGAAAVAAWLWVEVRTGAAVSPREGPTHLEEPPATQPARLEMNELSSAEAGLARAETAAAERAASAPSFDLNGRCLDSRGAPLANVEVSWSVLADESALGDPDAWMLLDASELEALATTTTTDANGSYSFRASTELARAQHSAVWATRPEHRAEVRILNHDAMGFRPLALEPIVMTVEASPRFLVVDGNDHPVPGAVIEIRGLHPFSSPDIDPLEQLASRLFLRRLRTDETGVAKGFTFSSWAALHSHLGAARSATVQVRRLRNETHRLVLGESCRASGRVIEPTGNRDLTKCRVRCLAEDGSGISWILGESLVGVAGAWGPLELPISGEVRQIRFEGGGEGVFVHPEAVDAPLSGAALVVELQAVAAEPLEFLVVDSARSAVPGARVTVSMPSRERWAPSSAHSNSAGVARVPNCVRGPIRVRAAADGYVTFDADVVEFDEQLLEERPVIELARAGRVAGRVTNAGAPVRDFDLVYWQGSPLAYKSTRFSNREDGAFEIESAPLGEVWVMAAQHPHGQTETRAVVVAADETQNVELEFPGAVRARGRVIDAETLAPIEAVDIRLWARARTQLVSQLGALSKTNGDGEFELAGVTPEANSIMVTREGYGMVIAPVEGERADTWVRMVDIPLTRKQPLTVLLRSTAEEDFTQYMAEFVLQDWAPHPVRFDATGRAFLREFTPGRVVTTISSRDIYLVTAAFERPGAPAEQVLELDPSTTLQVSVRCAAPERLEGAALVLSYPGPNGRGVDSHGAETKPGIWIFSSVPARHAVLSLMAIDGLLCSAPVALTVGANEFELSVPSVPLELRVVAPSGVPVAGAIVRLDSASAPGWSPYVLTDSDGRAKVPLGQFADLRASIFSETHGIAADLPLRAPPVQGAAAELLLDASCELDIALVDGAAPLPAVRFHLFNSATTLDYGNWISGSDGVARIPRAMRGEGYCAVIDQPGLWRTRAPLAVEARRSRIRIEVRRTGELEVLLNSAGSALPGVQVDLRSAEFGVDVREWIAAGRISADPPSLHSDSDGRVVLRGLPRGEYELAVRNQRRSVVVPPRARASETVTILD